jgi:hypothetical protein
MSGLHYEDIQHKPNNIKDLTSLTQDEFQTLVPVFEQHFQARMSQWRLDGKKRTVRQYTTYANSPLPTAEDRLLFILVYMKNQSLQVLHGRLFNMAQCKANQWIHVLLPILLAALKSLGDTPARSLAALALRLGVDEASGLLDSAQETDSPLFAMTGPNARLDGPRMISNKKAVLAGRKSVTR